MSVSNYTPDICRYKIDKLENVVYIVDKEGIGAIRVDNGDAYVDGVGYYNAIDCLSVSLNENESLDERYEFVHTVNFSVRGYLKISDLNDYYIMLRDKNDTYWLVNPYFKIKYTYTYTLDNNSNHTDYVVSTKSNYPMLRVNNFDAENVKPCNTYDYCAIDVMAINETTYSRYVESFSAELQQYVGKVKYTNDGFKVVKYLKNSCVFTESFDGKNISHSIKFNINFDDYKSSWHYNLLEFQNNKYAVVLSTRCDDKIACGFNFGLQPSYTVTASNDEVNSIEITLSDLHDTGSLLKMPSELPFEHDSGTTWNNVQGEYTCLDTTTAVYTLRQEYDVFGNQLNNYMCLVGFEDRYADLHIVGTFSDEDTFYCPQCRAEECTLQTSLPSNITFYNTECKTFTIRSNSDFTISSNSNYITVSPTSGAANTLYTVAVCNSKTPSSTANLYNLTVTYCSGLTKGYTVTVVNEPVTDCLPNGDEYNVSVYAQDVTIPTNCCIQSVSASCCVSNIQIQNGYVKFRIDANDTGSERTITVIFTKCDNTTVTATITQAHYYSRWVYEGRQCHENQMCALDRMYSGVTQDNINTPTYITRYRDCESSSECSSTQYKWENMNPSEGYYCNDCQGQYKWENMNPNEGYYCNDCSAEPQYRWINLDLTYNYYCEGTTKYYKQQQQISVDGGQTWENVSPAQYRRGESAQTQSSDCGYIPTIKYKWENMNPSTDYYCLDCQPAMYEWRRITPISGDSSTFVCDVCCVNQYRWVDLDPTVDYYCSGTTKYYKQQKQVSTDCGESWDWVSPAEYQWGASAQSWSTDCGYVPMQRTTSGTPYCSGETGYDKYVDVYSQVSYDGGSTWVTTATTPTLVEAQSTDCGYVPPQYRRTHSGNYCIGCVVYCDIYSEISYDNGSNWDITAITPTVVSDDCGECANTEYSALVLQSGSTYYINGVTALTWQSICRTYDTNTAFAKAVTSVKIGKSITTLANYSSVGTFSSMGIGRILIPNTVTAIENMAFRSCDYITTVYIPDSVQGSLGVECFYHCDKLSSIRIGSGITYLGRECFNYSTKLETIIITAVNPPSLGSSVFARTNLKRIYVPAESVEAYKSAWGMASIIKPIPY